jgi:hypothetical protein
MPPPVLLQPSLKAIIIRFLVVWLTSFKGDRNDEKIHNKNINKTIGQVRTLDRLTISINRGQPLTFSRIRTVLLSPSLFFEADKDPEDAPGQEDRAKPHINKDIPLVIPRPQVEREQGQPQERGQNGHTLPAGKFLDSVQRCGFRLRLISQLSG